MAQFGVFSLLSVPDVQNEVALVQGELEINVAAEASGFDSVWLAEHSGSRYGLIASPQVMAAAIAARTSRIRIGTAVSVLPLHHPLRLANDFAMIDVLSSGRLDYGIGRGYSADEYASYGLSVTENRGRFDEALAIIKQAWTQESFSYDGEYYTIPQVQAVPKVIQRPHPPLYIAAGSESTVEWAGANLVRMLSSSGSPANIRKKWDTFRAAGLAAGHSAEAVEDAYWIASVCARQSATQGQSQCTEVSPRRWKKIAPAGVANSRNATDAAVYQRRSSRTMPASRACASRSPSTRPSWRRRRAHSWETNCVRTTAKPSSTRNWKLKSVWKVKK